MIGLDCDGVILNYSGHKSLDLTRVNPDLQLLLPRDDRKVAILTNQGGMALHRFNPLRYPPPTVVARRLLYASHHLRKLGYSVEFVGVSAFHPRADASAIQSAAAVVRRSLKSAGLNATVFTTPRARKPSPYMLMVAGVSLYFGDSPEDAEAAAAAGVPFINVPRF